MFVRPGSGASRPDAPNSVDLAAAALRERPFFWRRVLPTQGDLLQHLALGLTLAVALGHEDGAAAVPVEAGGVHGGGDAPRVGVKS